MKKKSNHYPWWGYVKHIVQTYPNGSADGVKAREAEAVRNAVSSTMRLESGESRLNVIRMVHWDRTHTLAGAALEIPCGRATAARWQRRFFEEVARNRGLLD